MVADLVSWKCSGLVPILQDRETRHVTDNKRTHGWKAREVMGEKKKQDDNKWSLSEC